MKRLLLIVLSITTSVVSARQLVDTIRARVDGVIITQSMLEESQITKNGQPFTLQEAIDEQLWVARAHERKVVPSDEDVERSILAYKEENGLSDMTAAHADEFLLKQIGINFAQYRAQLKRHYAVEQLKSMEMRNRASVSEVEVRSYYDTHPVRIQAEYRMDIATITESQRHEWQKTKALASSLSWDSYDWFKHNDVAQHLRAVYDLKKGEVSEPIAFRDKFLVIRLLDKKEARVQTLTERYGAIEMMLQREKVERGAREIEESLRTNAVIQLL